MALHAAVGHGCGADGVDRGIEPDTERAGDAQRRRRVVHHVRAAHAEADIGASPRGRDREPGPCLAVELDVADVHVGAARRPEPQHAGLGVVGHGVDVWVVGVEDRRPARRQRFDELSLGDGDARQSTQPLGVRRADLRDDSDPRAGDPTQPGDLAEAAHPHLHDERAAAIVGVEDRHGEALVVVEAAPVRRDEQFCRQRRSRHVLRGGLADAAGDGDDGGVGSLARPGGGVPQRSGGVGDGDRRRLGGPVDLALRREVGDGAGLDGRRDEIVAVASCDDRHEELTALDRARVEVGAADRDVVADERRAERTRQFGCAEPHTGERYRRTCDGRTTRASRRRGRRARADPPDRALRR
ncbi:MAG: hypothetical protein WKF58_19450 [Ilumatobacteraceae bacterium]